MGILNHGLGGGGREWQRVPRLGFGGEGTRAGARHCFVLPSGRASKRRFCLAMCGRTGDAARDGVGAVGELSGVMRMMMGEADVLAPLLAFWGTFVKSVSLYITPRAALLCGENGGSCGVLLSAQRQVG